MKTECPSNESFTRGIFEICEYEVEYEAEQHYCKELGQTSIFDIDQLCVVDGTSVFPSKLSSDVIQFEVDVVENTQRLTHGLLPL